MSDDSAELVIGLVGPVGCELARVEEALEEVLEAAAYERLSLRLSTIFDALSHVLPPIDGSSEYLRLRSAMAAGDAFRERTERPEIMVDEEAVALIREDEGGGTKHGQATRETFELADLFVDGAAADLNHQLSRFLDLLLGCPNHTPKQSEHAMFLAFAASLRSGEMSRQPEFWTLPSMAARYMRR